MKTKRSTFSLFFYINKKREDKEGQCPIFLRISVNNTQTAVSIKRKIHAKDWDPKGFPKRNTSETKDLNNYINILRNKLFTIQEELVLKEDYIDADMFRMALFGTSNETPVMVMSLYREQMDKELILFSKGAKKTNSDYGHFKCSARCLTGYLMEKWRVTDIMVRKIDKAFVMGFVEYLQLRPTLGYNRQVRMLEKLKNVLERAVEKEVIAKNPFQRIDLRREEEKGQVYLEEEEVQQFLKTSYSHKSLKDESKYFSFSMYTGMANIDVQNLTRGKLHKINDQWWVQIYREKSGEFSNILLLPQAMDIIRLYQPNFETMPLHEKIFPAVGSLVKRNLLLKEIAKESGIHKKLTTHVARHTFATTITLTNDVPLETVGKMLGHKSVLMTQRYARIVDNKIKKDMDGLSNKLSAIYQ